jgi:hypothetical protein
MAISICAYKIGRWKVLIGYKNEIQEEKWYYTK